jgi:seryl-tRNA synthetase
MKMPADVTETASQEELLEQFQTRYQNLLRENNELSKKIKDNEATALKLLGAIETLQYLAPKEEEAEEEETPAAE